MRTSSAIRLALVFAFSVAPSISGQYASAQGCKNCSLAAVDWTTLPSTYTHRDGVAVDQYDQGVEPTTYVNESRQTSIYRYERSSLQGNNSVDHYHRVDQYGSPVQPYGEWRYPYRPYSVPYSAWGPQLPQVYSNFGFGGGVGNGGGHGGRGRMGTGGGYGGNWPYGGGYGQGQPNRGMGGGYPNMGNGSGLIPGPGNALTPGQDEYYPDAPEPAPMSDRDFFYTPYRPQ
jgi:hypothetical protein